MDIAIVVYRITVKLLHLSKNYNKCNIKILGTSVSLTFVLRSSVYSRATITVILLLCYFAIMFKQKFCVNSRLACVRLLSLSLSPLSYRWFVSCFYSLISEFSKRRFNVNAPTLLACLNYTFIFYCIAFTVERGTFSLFLKYTRQYHAQF